MEMVIICLLTFNNLFSNYREGGHLDLAERLTHSQYELTDRLTFFVCGKRPGNHFRPQKPFPLFHGVLFQRCFVVEGSHLDIGESLTNSQYELLYNFVQSSCPLIG